MQTIFRWTVRISVGIVAALVLLITVWSVIAGPVTVFRVITNGDTTVYDYKRFPGRSLSASSTPFQFNVAMQNNVVPQPLLIDGFGEVNFDDTFASSKTLAFLVIQDDVILYEHYANGHSKSAISQIFSGSKSLLSILIGAAIDDGLITSVQDSVTLYVPELARGGFETVTIENLLNMQSNMDYFENDTPYGEHVIFNFTDQLEREILKLRLLPEPEKQFRYKSGDNALLGLILQRALGEKTITQYMQERLWNPLGMEYGGVWGVDRPDGLERTWCCLSLSARDLAKFGRLYMNQGSWNGKQIISSDWVKNSTTKGAYKSGEWPDNLTDLGATNYKYQWWLLPEGDFSTWGKDGQYVYVKPEKNLIIVRLGETDGGIPWFKVFQEIAKGIQ